MSKMLIDRKPIGFPQLCALVRSIIQQEPTIDDHEWKTRTLERMAAMGFEEPDDHAMVNRAMSQVEFAVPKTLGPRLSPLKGNPEPAKPVEEYRFEGRTNRPAGWDLVQKMMAELYPKASPDSAKPSQPEPADVPLTEIQAVNEFWHQCRQEGADKLALLRAFGEIAIIRSIDWNPERIRAEFQTLWVKDVGCFACGKDATVWHHIIQIQHGGSNYVRNRVPLCEACHGSIHPWLEKRPRSGGWFSFSDWLGEKNRRGEKLGVA